jgi:hypothetical protein
VENEHLFSTGHPWCDRAMPDRRDTPDLRATADPESLTVWLSTTAVVFDRSSARRSVGLRFGRLGVGPDVSAQPAAVTAVVDDEARLAAIDPNRWRIGLLRELFEWEANLRWCDRAPGQLTGVVGAFTHPLLAELYRQGCGALGEIPRWASPILRSQSAADAARRLAGGDTTRRLTRAVACSLRGADGTVGLNPLAFAVAGAGLVSHDELANVVEAASGSANRSPVIGVEHLRTIRTVLGLYPQSRRAALLIDAARHHTPLRLAEVLSQLHWIIDRTARPLPQRVNEVAECCSRLVPVLSPPARPAPPDPVADLCQDPQVHPSNPATNEPARAPNTSSRRPPGTATRQPRTHHAALTAPTAPTRAPQSWPVPRPLLPISGYHCDGLTFCVPTSANELTWWSRQLHNCLDTFAAAAAHQRSWLIGIRHDDNLIGCIEVCPRTRRLRQAHGPRNRPLPNHIYDTALRVLDETGILTAPISR